MVKRFSHSVVTVLLVAIVACLIVLVNAALTVKAQPYGTGAYGSCQYGGSCSISLTSSGSVALNVIPASGGRCTVASDAVQVMTSSGTGYTLQLASSTTATTLAGASAGGSIAAGSGTVTAPQPLTVNRWGFRIDGGAFGPGPTNASTNAPLSSTPYAGIPSSASPATIKAPSTTPPNPDPLTVWYGLCVDVSIPADTYSRVVRYTAVVNP